jgi:hypothetical protein
MFDLVIIKCYQGVDTQKAQKGKDGHDYGTLPPPVCIREHVRVKLPFMGLAIIVQRRPSLPEVFVEMLPLWLLAIKAGSAKQRQRYQAILCEMFSFG